MPRAVAIEFIGRRSAKPGIYYTGENDNVVAVDKLLEAKLLGKVRTIYQGGDGTIGTAALFFTWSTDTSDTDVVKVLIRDQGGSVKARY